jgi:hypothetical protein
MVAFPHLAGFFLETCRCGKGEWLDLKTNPRERERYIEREREREIFLKLEGNKLSLTSSIAFASHFSNSLISEFFIFRKKNFFLPTIFRTHLHIPPLWNLAVNQGFLIQSLEETQIEKKKPWETISVSSGRYPDTEELFSLGY